MKFFEVVPFWQKARLLFFEAIFVLISMIFLIVYAVESMVRSLRPLYGWWFEIIPEFRAVIFLITFATSVMWLRYEGEWYGYILILLSNVVLCPTFLFLLLLVFSKENEEKQQSNE